MDILVYAANLLYLSSYLVRDILYLRLLTIVAAGFLVAYFYNQQEPLMTVVYWNLSFVALNAMQLAWILRERRIRMTRWAEDKGVAEMMAGWSRAI